MGKKGKVDLLYSGQGFLLVATTHAHEVLYLIASFMSEVLKLYKKQTQGGCSWNVDKPKKNGEDVSMGETLFAYIAIM